MYEGADDKGLNEAIVKDFLTAGDFDPKYQWYENYSEDCCFYVEVFSKEELPLQDVDRPYIAARFFEIEQGSLKPMAPTTGGDENMQHKILIRRGSQ